MYAPLTNAYTITDPEHCSDRELKAYAAQYEALLSCLDRHKGPAGLCEKVREALHLVLRELENRGYILEPDTRSRNHSLDAARHEFNAFGGIT